jgi:hypothetical protein
MADVPIDRLELGCLELALESAEESGGIYPTEVGVIERFLSKARLALEREEASR